MKRDPRYFYANTFAKEVGKVGTLEGRDGKLHASAEEKGEVLTAQFE